MWGGADKQSFFLEGFEVNPTIRCYIPQLSNLFHGRVRGNLKYQQRSFFFPSPLDSSIGENLDY